MNTRKSFAGNFEQVNFYIIKLFFKPPLTCIKKIKIQWKALDVTNLELIKTDNINQMLIMSECFL